MIPRLTRSALVAVVLSLHGASALAQADHNIVFPLAMQAREGDSYDNALVNATYMRYQQIDSDSLNNGHVVKFLRFRQDGSVTSPQAVNRTIEAEISMGAGLMPWFGDDFDANYLPLTKQVIMSRTTIHLPDWSQVPASPPKPFDLAFPMSFVWSHSGLTNLIWDMEVWNGSGQPYYHVDADSAPGFSASTPVLLGTGCTTGTGVYANSTSLAVTNFDADYSLGLSVTGAPAGAVVSFLLGTTDPNLAVGLCAPLRVTPDVTLPIGVADAGGNAAVTLNATNYNPAWVGLLLYTQAVSPDVSQPLLPLAFSNGVETSFPAHAHDIKHVFTTTPGATTGTGPVQGGIVIEISDTN